MSIPGVVFRNHTHLVCIVFSPIDWLEETIFQKNMSIDYSCGKPKCPRLYFPGAPQAKLCQFCLGVLWTAAAFRNVAALECVPSGRLMGEQRRRASLRAISLSQSTSDKAFRFTPHGQSRSTQESFAIPRAGGVVDPFHPNHGSVYYFFTLATAIHQCATDVSRAA